MRRLLTVFNGLIILAALVTVATLFPVKAHAVVGTFTAGGPTEIKITNLTNGETVTGKSDAPGAPVGTRLPENWTPGIYEFTFNDPADPNRTTTSGVLLTDEKDGRNQFNLVSAQGLVVRLDNRPWSLIGIPAGKDPQEVADQFAEYQVISIPGGGKIVRVPGDVRTVAGLVGGFNPAFVEIDPCTIMTPLSAFRGHDHESHMQSHRGTHDHEAPDPPWTWGVTPPEIAIRWEADQ